MPMVGWSGPSAASLIRNAALELGAGPGQVTQVLQHAAEVAAPDADGGVVRAQRRLADLQDPLVLRPSSGRSPIAPRTRPSSSRRQATSGSSDPSATSVRVTARSASGLACRYWPRPRR